MTRQTDKQKRQIKKHADDTTNREIGQAKAPPKQMVRPGNWYRQVRLVGQSRRAGTEIQKNASEWRSS